MRWNITAREEWRHWVTPRLGRVAARHRWFLFPHSFSSALVEALAKEWELTVNDRILDPFVGSGTTLLSAKELGIPCAGFDISPLSVLACNGKTRSYSKRTMEQRWRELTKAFERETPSALGRDYPELVRGALPDGRLEILDHMWTVVSCVGWPDTEREFFELAILAIVPRVSYAVANGGWLRWTNQGMEADRVAELLEQQVLTMLEDLDDDAPVVQDGWEAEVADARTLPVEDGEYSAVISSPPYPNRHDYTRIFGVELMFAFQDWEQNRALRYQSFHSHPEARPERTRAENYRQPAQLAEILTKCVDGRVRRMLEGYFLDMYLSLREVMRACRSGGRVAYVVGNARYYGIDVPVDEFTADVGEQAGLYCEEIRIVRWRGNSAQQMGKYGRAAARESVVLFSRP